ncbi:RHS repeat-associated core domain-containing protein [Bernardetia sp. Wsw4-3y2]|uniref:RHS repeat domain-containing protein n=1 Tax=Bernardetia sp. Wsw4-3y2 TaxID=3127471 RepID=UPI0030CE13BA
MGMKGLEKENDLAYQFNGMIEREKAFGLELYETANRGYDPQIGRFWQVEPLADLFVGINVYQFGYNNPVSYNDPSGLSPNDIPGECTHCGLIGGFHNPHDPSTSISNFGLWMWFSGNGERTLNVMGGGFSSGSFRSPTADRMVLVSGRNQRAQNVVYGVGEGRGGIDLSDLKAGDPAGAYDLVLDLQRFTGLGSLHINKKGFLDYDRGYWWGKLRGGFNDIKNPSAIARRELIRAIKSKNITQVLNNYDGAYGKIEGNSKIGMGNKADPSGNIIYFDRHQIEGIQGGASYGLRKAGLQRTWGLATNFFHEYKHTLNGGGLLDNVSAANPLGDTASWVNQIRKQMNLPLMQQYTQEKYETPVEGFPWLDNAFGVMFFDKTGLNHFKLNYKYRGNYKFNKNHLYMLFPSNLVGM